MSTIFISHSSKDNAITTEFKRRLKSQGHRSVFLDFDPELGIPPGRNWEPELYRHLRVCQAVVVLCSEHSMSSRWCFAEITYAKSLGKCVFPVKIGPCTIDSVLMSRQIIDLTQNQEDAYQSLWRGLKLAGLDPADSFDWDQGRSPYPGMMAFQEEDAAVFFGREPEIQQLMETLKQLRQFGGTGMLLVLGASGCGKSSLVRAGLLPRLRRKPEEWLTVDPFRPMDDPLRELSMALAQAFNVSDKRKHWQDIHTQLEQAVQGQEHLEKTILHDVITDLQITRQQREATTLLIIDQAEELFVRSAGNRMSSFLSILSSAMEETTCPLIVIFALRSDFLGEFHRRSGLPAHWRKHIAIGPMVSEHLAKIIEGPAGIADIEIEDGLTEVMVHDTQSQNALPLLAFTLRALYETRDGDKRLAIHAYKEKLGGLSGAVALVADATLSAAQLSTHQQNALRNAFISLACINEEGRFTRQPTRWTDHSESVHDALERFVQARLLTSWGEGKERLLEVTHEVLFYAWDRLNNWLDENREFLLWRKRFTEAWHQWLRTDRAQRALLAGPALNEGEHWKNRRGEQFTLEEREYLNASVRSKRKRRYQRVGALVLMLLFLISVSIGGVVLWQRAEKALLQAKQQAEFARRGTYAIQLARARELWRRDPSRSLELLKDTVRAPLYLRDFTWGFLYGLANKMRMTLSGHGHVVLAVAFSPDGKTIATASADKTVKLWDALTGQEYATLTGHDGSILSVAFSPDGKTIATASGDKTIKLWNALTGQARNTLTGHRGGVFSVVFSPNGKYLATASADKTVRLWNAQTGKKRATLTGHREWILSVAFSPDGKTLATASGDKTIRLWNARTGQRRATLKGHGHGVSSVAFSHDGRTLASASWDKTIKLWDLQTRKERITLTGHSGLVSSVAFSPNGKTLASASEDKTVKLWDALTGQERITLTGHGLGISSLAFSPNGMTLATASNDRSVKLWDPLTDQERSTLTGHNEWILSVAFSPNGKILATASVDKTIKLWCPQTCQEQTTLIGHSDWVSSVAFSPDGKILATASEDETIKLWDVLTGIERTTLTGHNDWVLSVAFSPDGKILATASADKTIKLWDTRTGQERITLIGHGEEVSAVAFSPSGISVATASVDKTIKLWNTRTGQEKMTLTGHDKWISSVTFSPDSKTLASASGDLTIKLWDTQTGQERTTLTGHGGAVLSVAFSPDGKTLASASGDKTVKLWDTLTGQERATLVRHGERVSSLSFSPDGKTLATVSYDHTVRLWSAETGLEHATHFEYGDNVLPEAFSHNRKIPTMEKIGALERLQ